MRTCCQDWAHATPGRMFMCQRLLSRALHALRVRSPLCEGLGRETHPAAPSAALEERGLPGHLCHEAGLVNHKQGCVLFPPTSHPAGPKGSTETNHRIIKHRRTWRSLLLLKVLSWIKALGLETSSSNSKICWSHVALHTNLHSLFLF